MEHKESSVNLKGESYKYPEKDVITSPFDDLRGFFLHKRV